MLLAAIARELAHRIVVGGQPPLVAAAEMRLTRDQVYKVMRGAAYRRESAELFALVGDEKRGVVAEATRRLCELLPKAVDTTDRILESEHRRCRCSSGRKLGLRSDWLERSETGR